MKLALSNGREAKVEVFFKTKEVPAKSGLVECRTTEVCVTLPGNALMQGQMLSAVVACDTRDAFCRRSGRYAALMKLLQQDNNQAIEQAIEKASSKLEKCHLDKPVVEEGSLRDAAKQFYKLSRKDRTLVFKTVCPEFSRNDPQRVAQREKSLYERLAKKYGTPPAGAKKAPKTKTNDGEQMKLAAK